MIAADSLLMKLLLSAAAAWLSVTSDLPASFERPQVALVPPAQIAALRYPTVNPAFRPNVLAVYDDASRTIYLHDAWTGASLADLSVLVHEMAHHLQNRGRLTYSCPGAREAPAYEAQQRFLHVFRRSVVDEFQLDRMALKLMTSCRFF